MGEYRLVVADGSVLETFTADDDRAAVAMARAQASRRPIRELFFTVQVATEGEWSDIATWVPRPLGRQQAMSPAVGATRPRRVGSGPTSSEPALAYCCDEGAAVYPRACPRHGTQVPRDIVGDASADD